MGDGGQLRTSPLRERAKTSMLVALNPFPWALNKSSLSPMTPATPLLKHKIQQQRPHPGEEVAKITATAAAAIGRIRRQFDHLSELFCDF